MRILNKYVKDMFITFKRKEVKVLPSYISFYILLSFIPLLSLVLLSLALINQNNQQLLVMFSEIFPDNVYHFIRQFVDYSAMNMSVFTINNLVLLYLASRIYYSIYHSNSIILKTKCCRNFFYDKIIALISTLIIIFTILILVFVLLLGRYLNLFLSGYLLWTNNLSLFLQIVISLGALVLFTSSIMLSLPDYNFKFKKIWKGSLVSAILMMVMSFGFKIYVDVFSNYDNVYFTFSTILIFILWVFLMSYSILIGLIVNSSVNKKLQ